MIQLNNLRQELIEVQNDELVSVVGGQFDSPREVIIAPTPAPVPAPIPGLAPATPGMPSITTGVQVTPGVGTQVNGTYTNGYSTFSGNGTFTPRGVTTYGGSMTIPLRR